MIHLRFVSIRVSIATQRRLFQNAKEAEQRAASNNKNLQLDCWPKMIIIPNSYSNSCPIMGWIMSPYRKGTRFRICGCRFKSYHDLERQHNLGAVHILCNIGWGGVFPIYYNITWGGQLHLL